MCDEGEDEFEETEDECTVNSDTVTDSDVEQTDRSKENCECENVRKVGSIKGRETGVVVATAYKCEDCGSEFVD